ncbi:hypothetical protein K438DRAFT_1966572 [Mycena galopus ATCC 62051]|nr:hypothetical protein K438DRAFT_1966572 [Mycena galopus ATCC 62051]
MRCTRRTLLPFFLHISLVFLTQAILSNANHLHPRPPNVLALVSEASHRTLHGTGSRLGLLQGRKVELPPLEIPDDLANDLPPIIPTSTTGFETVMPVHAEISFSKVSKPPFPFSESVTPSAPAFPSGKPGFSSSSPSGEPDTPSTSGFSTSDSASSSNGPASLSGDLASPSSESASASITSPPVPVAPQDSAVSTSSSTSPIPSSSSLAHPAAAPMPSGTIPSASNAFPSGSPSTSILPPSSLSSSTPIAASANTKTKPKLAGIIAGTLVPLLVIAAIGSAAIALYRQGRRSRLQAEPSSLEEWVPPYASGDMGDGRGGGTHTRLHPDSAPPWHYPDEKAGYAYVSSAGVDHHAPWNEHASGSGVLLLAPDEKGKGGAHAVEGADTAESTHTSSYTPSPAASRTQSVSSSPPPRGATPEGGDDLALEASTDCDDDHHSDIIAESPVAATEDGEQTPRSRAPTFVTFESDRIPATPLPRYTLSRSLPEVPFDLKALEAQLPSGPDAEVYHWAQ